MLSLVLILRGMRARVRLASGRPACPAGVKRPADLTELREADQLRTRLDTCFAERLGAYVTRRGLNDYAPTYT